METRKAHDRRVREGFFDKYCHGRGIDIGVGRLEACDGADPLLPDIDCWDKDNGDATFMASVADETYDFVYSSHCLEHISNVYLALRNWWRILKRGGFLILSVPHRDLYEKKRELPSTWNPDHKFYLLPDMEDLPYTVSFKALLLAALPDADVISVQVCSDGHTITDPNMVSDGEISIEAILRKPLL